MAEKREYIGGKAWHWDGSSVLIDGTFTVQELKDIIDWSEKNHGSR